MTYDTETDPATWAHEDLVCYVFDRVCTEANITAGRAIAHISDIVERLPREGLLHYANLYLKEERAKAIRQAIETAASAQSGRTPLPGT